MKELTDADFARLLTFLKRVPANDPVIGFGHDGVRWWVEFALAIGHPLAWEVVQEFGHIFNYLSLNERLPTVFYPVSPPPHMNGGPENFFVVGD